MAEICQGGINKLIQWSPDWGHPPGLENHCSQSKGGSEEWSRVGQGSRVLRNWSRSLMDIQIAYLTSTGGNSPICDSAEIIFTMVLSFCPFVPLYSSRSLQVPER